MLAKAIIRSFVFLLFLSFWSSAKVANQGCVLSLMPCPQTMTLADGRFTLDHNANIYIEGMSDKRQQAAVTRLTAQLKRLHHFDFSGFTVVLDKAKADLIIVVNDNLSANSSTLQYPRLGDDESYQLTINQANISIQSKSEFGALHGLTTLVQLIYAADSDTHKTTTDSQSKLSVLALPLLHIADKPEFKWRGLLIDSVRHFIPLTDIKRQLDGMAAAKLNVFHWHLNDDQGWRIESKRYPKLQQLASDNLYYTQEEIKEVVAYASLLGIRVVPELDVPGHASAIAVAYPELIAEKKQYVMQRHWGVFEPVLDVSDPKVYQFIDDLVAEFSLLFPDSYLHIGGDEVNPAQWLNNDNIQLLMEKEKLADVEALHHYFNLKVQAILAKYQRKMMGWDEIYHPDLPKDIIIQSWRGLESINKFANQGYQGVLSTGFYIDQPQSSAYHYRNHAIVNGAIQQAILNENYRSWSLSIPRLKGSAVTGHFILATEKNSHKTEETSGYLKLNNNAYKKVSIYPTINNQSLRFSMDSWMGPLSFEIELTAQTTNRVFIGNAFYPLLAEELSTSDELTLALPNQLAPEQSKQILGGEAALWSELVTQDNIDLRTWPRLFVIAERLWSKPQLSNIDNMYQRLKVMDRFAADITGLQHKVQQQKGFSALLKEHNSEQNIHALLQLAQLVEPAHYYTRHHIKYQQHKYHQLAALDGFVDFLAVESVQMIELNKWVEAHQQGNPSALAKIRSKVKTWQDNQLLLNPLKTHDPELNTLIKDIEVFNQVAENIVQLCSNQPLSPQFTSSQLHHQLKRLQERQNETVIAAIPVFEKLLASCQE